MLVFGIYLGLNLLFIKFKLHYSLKIKLVLFTFYILMSIVGIYIWQINKGFSLYIATVAIFMFSQGVNKVIRISTTQKMLKDIKKN